MDGDTLHFRSRSGAMFSAEQVRSPEAIKRGLMFRQSQPRFHGMFFNFTRPDIRAMWMKNMRIPLDIVWLGAEGKIVHISYNAPPCKTEPCPSYSSIYKTNAAIELNAGEVTLLGLRVGDRLRIVKAV
jgi:uncharacterized membrane protein (UPF0127 family)